MILLQNLLERLSGSSIMINLKDEIKFPCGLSHSKKIFVSSFFLFIMSIYGGINLGVENSFVNYFKKNTEIYKQVLHPD